MEDLPGFPPGLISSHGKEVCRDVLLQVMKEHIDTQWFHINDLPRPIRRVFYARMKQCAPGEHTSDRTAAIRLSPHTVDEAAERTFVSPLTGHEIKIPKSKSGDEGKMIKRPLNDVTKCLERKEVRQEHQSLCPERDVLLRSSTHLFPKNGKDGSRIIYRHFIMPPGGITLEKWREDQKVRGKTTQVEMPEEIDYGCINIDLNAKQNESYKQFWEDCSDRKISGLVIPKSSNVFNELLACCNKQFRGCDIIYRRVTRCDKMFIDYRVVRKGAYHRDEFCSLFSDLQMEGKSKIERHL